MSIYLVIVMLALPAPQAQPAPAVELARSYITASTPAVCQAYADRMAAAARQQHVDSVRRLGASVRGTCHLLDIKP